MPGAEADGGASSSSAAGEACAEAMNEFGALLVVFLGAFDLVACLVGVVGLLPLFW